MKNVERPKLTWFEKIKGWKIRLFSLGWIITDRRNRVVILIPGGNSNSKFEQQDPKKRPTFIQFES